MDEEEEQKQKIKLQEKLLEQEAAKKKFTKVINQKQERISRLENKFEQLQQEELRIKDQHQRAKLKYQQELQVVKKKPKKLDQNQQDHEEHEKYIKNVEEKIQFHMNKYLAPLEKNVKTKIEVHNKLLSLYAGDRDFDYQKTQFPAVSFKIKNEQIREFMQKQMKFNEQNVPETEEDKIDKIIQQRIIDSKDLVTVFRIKKNTIFKQLKEQAMQFWDLKNKHKRIGFSITDDELMKKYELFDEFDKRIKEEEEVEKWFLSNSDYVSAQFTMRLAADSSPDDLEGDEGENDENDDDKDKDDDANNLAKTKNLFYNYCKAVFKHVPLVQSFFKLDDIIIDKKWKQHQSQVRKGFLFDDNHCCFFFLVVIMLLLTFFQMYYGVNLWVMSMHNNLMLDKLNIEKSETLLHSEFQKSWTEISSLNDFQLYMIGQGMNNELFRDIHYEHYKGTLLKEYSVVGQIRLRQFRTKEEECSDDLKNLDKQCYYEDINDETIYTDNLGDGYYEWQHYKQHDQVNQTRIVNGDFRDYPSHGYILDIDPNVYYDKYFVDIEEAFHQGLTDKSSKGFIININLINKNDGNFVFVELILEQTGFGTFSKYDVITFIPNFAESPHGDTLSLLQTLRIFFVGIQSILLLYRIFCYDSLDLRYLFQLQGLLNLAIIVFSSLAITYEIELDDLGLNQEKIQDIVDNNYFYDSGTAAYKFQTIIRFQCIVIGSIFIRLVLYFTFLKPFDMIIKTLENSASQIISNFVFVFFIISGFAVLSMNYYKDILDFKTFQRGFVNLLLTIVGIFDFNKLEATIFGVIFLAIYVFLIGFFLMNMITATYVDEYRLTYLDQGYEPEPDWTLKEKIRWMFSWVGQKNLKKCNLDEK